MTPWEDAAVVGPARLDDALWAPSPLGCVGPGLLTGMSLGGQYLYRPLLGVHRDRPGLGREGDRVVEVIDGDEAWDRLCADPEVQMRTGGKATHRPSDDIVVWVHRRGGTGTVAVLTAGIDLPGRPGIGEIGMVWTPDLAWAGPASTHEVLGFGWLRLFQEAAARGAVGLVAGIDDMGARTVAMLRELAGFRPAEDCYAEVGLSPADVGTVLDEWRLTVTDDVVTDLRLLHGDAVARAELLGLLPGLFFARSEPDAIGAPFRSTLGGPVGFDGCRQVGNVEPPDWSDPPGDVWPDDAPQGRVEWRTRWVVAQWLAAQAP